MAQQQQSSAASCSPQGSLPQQLQPHGSVSPTIHPQWQPSPTNIPPRQTSPTNSQQRQTSSTNNSPQQQEDAVQPPALLDCSAFLHHPCMLSDAAPVCRLLCTSKAAAAAAAEHMAGQLSQNIAAARSYRAQRTEWLKLWLDRNSGLVRSLDISCTCSGLQQVRHLATLLDKHSTAVSSVDLSFHLPYNPQMARLLSSLIAQHGCKLAGLSIDYSDCADELGGELDYELLGPQASCFVAPAAAEALLAEALQLAAADAAQGAQGLQLRSFRSTIGTGGPLLQQLPAASLTCLQLPQIHIKHRDEAAELQPVVAALRRLTGLQSLRMSSCFWALDSCLPALEGLSCLTSLELGCVEQLQLWKHLPCTLQQLSLVYYTRDVGAHPYFMPLEVSFDLSHLLQLHGLSVRAEYLDLTLAASSRLPGSLTALDVPDVVYSSASSKADGGSSSTSTCALLALTRLQQLNLRECSLTADAIAEVSSTLTGLTQVQLAYDAAACSAFGVGSDELAETALLAAAWSLLPLVSLSFQLRCCSSHSNTDLHSPASAEGGGVAGMAGCLDGVQCGNAGDEDDVVCCEGYGTAVMLGQLADLRGLTCLRIRVGDPQAQLPVYHAAALAACLRQLPGLESLHVGGRLVGGQAAVAELHEAVEGFSCCSLPKQCSRVVAQTVDHANEFFSVVSSGTFDDDDLFFDVSSPWEALIGS